MMSRRAGFTITELMVTLVILGSVLLTASRMTAALADSRDRVRERSATAAESGVGHRVLFDLLGRAIASPGNVPRFVGTATSARFSSWCESAFGWIERCEVDLRIAVSDTGAVLFWSPETGPSVTLVRRERLALQYLIGSIDSAPWAHEWGTAVDLPTVVALISERDTLLIPVGVP